MKDRWGALPQDEPRCQNCNWPLTQAEEKHGVCDACTLKLVRGMNAVDRAVKNRKDAA